MLVIVTNGGPHPPETLALNTAQAICPIDEDLAKTDGVRHLEALCLQAEIAKALVPHHNEVQKWERNALQNQPEVLLASPLGTDDGRLDESIRAIQQAALNTPWQAHFQEPEVVAVIRDELHRHFRTAQQIERQWHLDKAQGA